MRELIGVLFIAFCSVGFVKAQWVKQSVNTTSSFRGLSVVNEKIIWASGTGGTVIKTIDGGDAWQVMPVPSAEKLDFRDIEAFDANTAYILSIGSGESSRIYKTTDGGKTWTEQFHNRNERAFFDAIACWDVNNCIAMSDPVDHKFVLIETNNGGATWSTIDTSNMPATKDGEAAFAASGTCLITQGKNNAYLVTGGSDARVFKSTDRGRTWAVYDTPMVKGTPGSGIFSIAMYDDKKGAIVGGNYEKPEQSTSNLALTRDGGKTWRAVDGLSGYRSSVSYRGENSFYAVGPTGSDITDDNGKSWKSLGRSSFNVIVSKHVYITWAVGEKGMIANKPFLTKLFNIEPKTK